MGYNQEISRLQESAGQSIGTVDTLVEEVGTWKRGSGYPGFC